MKKTQLKRKTPLTRTGFKKKEPAVNLYDFNDPFGYVIIRKKKPRKRIKPRSKKREKLDKEYSVLRKEFLRRNPRCENCGKPATEVHHKGRRGKLYLDTRFFMAICGTCHRYLEEHPQWARSLGYLLTPSTRRLLA